MTTVSVAILSYNESGNLPLVLETLNQVRQALPEVVLRITVINNGSNDSTTAVIEEMEKVYPFVDHVTIPKNLGYGYGVQQGLATLQGEIVGFMWGDNQFDAAILIPMLETFLRDTAIQLVKTYRTKRHDGRLRLFVSKMYQFIFKVLYGIYTHDINSGPKLFRANFLKQLQPLRSTDWFIDAELMIKATRFIKPNQVKEFPITFFPRKFGKSNVRFSTCFQFLYNLVKYKFVKL